jgi:hypothetical protein
MFVVKDAACYVRFLSLVFFSLQQLQKKYAGLLLIQNTLAHSLLLRHNPLICLGGRHAIIG